MIVRKVAFLVKGCMGGVSRDNLRVHFLHHHIHDTILILEEGNCPHSHFPECDMFVP